MPLGLVPRGARAFAAHVNSMYRVFKGIDADSVAVRLNTGGAFEVRNSVTNLPVFKVTDAGLEGLIGTEDIIDSAITSAKIADGSIVNDDISPSAGIVVTKLAHVGAGNVLKSTGAANIGAQVVDADVGSTAAIGLAKLFHVGSGNVLKSNGTVNVGGQVAGSDIAANQITNSHVNAAAGIVYSKLSLGNGIVNADVNTAAAVLVSKLAAGSTANRVVATADGTTMAMQQVVGAMIADNTITSAKLAGGIPVPAGSITTAEIADGTIVNVDVNASAAIAVTKVAHVGAGNVLKSNGTQNVGGQVDTPDLAASSVTQIVSGVGGSGQSTTSTVPIFVTGLGTVNITVAVPAEVILMSYLRLQGNLVGAYASVLHYVDSVQTAEVGVQTFDSTLSFRTFSASERLTLAAGLHSFQLAIASSSASCTITVAASRLVAVALKK